MRLGVWIIYILYACCREVKKSFVKNLGLVYLGYEKLYGKFGIGWVGPPSESLFQPYPSPQCWAYAIDLLFINDQRVSNLCQWDALSILGFVCHCVCLIPLCLLYMLGTQRLGASLYLRGFQAGLINNASQCKALCNALYVMHTMDQGFGFSFCARFVSWIVKLNQDAFINRFNCVSIRVYPNVIRFNESLY